VARILRHNVENNRVRETERHKPSSMATWHRFLLAAEWWLCSNLPVQREQLQDHISSCDQLRQLG